MIKGRGTIATGPISGGSVCVGDPLVLEGPRDRKTIAKGDWLCAG